MAYLDSINTGNLPDPFYTNGRMVDLAVQYAAPLTGGTVTISGVVQRVVINPAGSLSALTLTFPSNPLNGTCIAVSCTQAVTTLTVNGGTVIGAPSAFTANQVFRWVYISAQTSWFPTT